MIETNLDFIKDDEGMILIHINLSNRSGMSIPVEVTLTEPSGHTINPRLEQGVSIDQRVFERAKQGERLFFRCACSYFIDGSPHLLLRDFAVEHRNDGLRVVASYDQTTEAEATLLEAQGRLEEAIIKLRQALNEVERQDNPLGINLVLLRLSGLHLENRELDKGEFYIRSALEHEDPLLNVAIRAQMFVNLASAQMLKGDFLHAHTSFDMTLKYAIALDDQHSIGVAQSGIGVCLRKAGRRDEAKEMLVKSITAAQQEGDSQAESRRTGNLAGVYLELEDIETAKTLLVRAVKLAVQAGDTIYLAGWTIELFERSLGTGDFTPLIEAAEAIRCGNLKHLPADLRCQLGSMLAMGYAEQGNLDLAIKRMTETIEIADNHHMPPRYQLRIGLASYQAGAGNHVRAACTLVEACEGAEKCGDMGLAERCVSAFSKLEQKNNIAEFGRRMNEVVERMSIAKWF